MTWLRVSLPRLPKILEQLRVLLGDGSTRGKSCAGPSGLLSTKGSRLRRGPLSVHSLGMIREIWSLILSLLSHLALSHLNKGFEVLMFSDASGLHWGSVMIQVPEKELPRRWIVISHRGCLSGTFRGAQLRWTATNRRDCVLIPTPRRLENFRVVNCIQDCYSAACAMEEYPQAVRLFHEVFHLCMQVPRGSYPHGGKWSCVL